MEFYGLLGEKLDHSISPEIHEKIFSLLKIRAAYKKFEVKKEDLQKFVDGLKVLGIKGANVTIPYKQTIIPYLDGLSEEAKKLNAINTILLKDGKLYGYNTDYFGFGTILQCNHIEVENKVCMVLGYGGAAKAVVQYLLDHGVKKLYIVSRRTCKDVYDDLRVQFMTYDEIATVRGDVLINTTSVGMYPSVDESPVAEEIIINFATLIDIIYNPRVTKFLEIGRRLDKKICGGLEMLVGQAIKAEEIWQEREISHEILTKVMDDFDKKFQ
ncbi:Shikimate 5-dehydrogenase I alpha [Caldibacillus thermoamylovorans]|uniref:shikimate dehydrogenase n=1 Tax=Bacillaceae TaxID=186817 RepID=UPI0005A422BB|nr:shikimate dehydrogenase [Caldibacillus thermoamylovorans]KIO63551.1 Shikimate 5-dehydrogenase I alpha [Caldibacillus thermoamylovorans]